MIGDFKSIIWTENELKKLEKQEINCRKLLIDHLD